MSINRNIWEKLYALAQKYVDAKPWERMHSNLLIEVDLPDGQSGYCSVLGNGEDLRGLVVYVGNEGLESILRMFNGRSIGRDDSQTGRTQECIGFFLGDREEVGEEQYAIIRELGLKFRGRGKWMYFERYRKYYYPFCPTDEEAGMMAAAMEGFLEAADHIPENEFGSAYQEPRILYYDRRKGKMMPPRFLPKDYPVDEIGQIDPAKEFTLKKAARKKNSLRLELGVFYMNDGVLDEEKHPYHARICLLAIYEGALCSYNLLTPQQSSGQNMTDLLSDWIEQNGMPKEVYIPDVVNMERIRPLTSFLKLKASVHPLPSINEFLVSMGGYGAEADHPEESDELLDELLSMLGMDRNEAERMAVNMSPDEFARYMYERMGLGLDDEDWEDDFWTDEEEDEDPYVIWSEPRTMIQKIRAVREFFSSEEEYAPDEKFIRFGWAKKPQKELLLCATKNELMELAKKAGLTLKTSLSKLKIADAILEQLALAQAKKASPVSGMPVEGSGSLKLAQYVQKEMKSWDEDPYEYEPPEVDFGEFNFSQEEVLDALRWGMVDVDLGVDDDDDCCLLRVAAVRDMNN